MTTAPTNEMLALADELDVKLPVFHGRERDLIVRVVTALRLAATPARDVREACANAAYCEPVYMGGNERDESGLLPPGSPYDRGRYDARKAILALDLDAASPAAGGDAEPVAWRWHWNFGDEPDVWAYSETLVTSDKDKTAEPLYAAPPLQALAPEVSIKPMALSDGRTDYFVSIRVGKREVTPHVFREEYKAAYHVALYDWLLNGGAKPDLMAFDENDWPAQALQAPAHSDAVREALKAAADWVQRYHDTFGELGDDATQANIDDWHDLAKPALTAPAAKAPAVSEADVGRKSRKCFWLKCSNRKRCAEFGSCVAIYQNAYKYELFAPIQSAAQGGGTEGGEA